MDLIPLSFLWTNYSTLPKVDSLKSDLIYVDNYIRSLIIAGQAVKGIFMRLARCITLLLMKASFQQCPHAGIVMVV